MADESGSGVGGWLRRLLRGAGQPDPEDGHPIRHRRLDPDRLRNQETRVSEAPAQPVRPQPQTSSPAPAAAPGSSTGGGELDISALFKAEFQESAKRADDAHKAKLRAHVERPKPPLTAEGRESLSLAGSACLAIRHIFPPRHPQNKLSFLGGDPLGPESLEIPMVHNRRGLLEALTFMAQIDLSAIPAGPGRPLLPKDGFLYFFAPMSGNFDASANHFVVRYVAGKAKKNWGPQGQGIAEPLEGEEAPFLFPWMNWRDRPETFYPRRYRRVEIELGWIDDGGEVEAEDADAEAGFPWEVAAQRQRDRLVAFHGEPIPYNPLFSRSGKPTDRIGLPWDGILSNARAAEILLGFIKTWLKREVAAIEARLAKLEPGAAEAEPLEARAESYRRFEREHCAAMRYINGPASNHAEPLPDAISTEILAMLETLRCGALGDAVAPTSVLDKSLPRAINDWIATAAVESAEAALLDPHACDQLPPNVVEALRYRHSVLRYPRFTEDGHYEQHQMLGRGRLVQTAAEDQAEEHVLLLQLSPDEGVGWRFGDNGVLQYWIHPADLADRRFENSFLTFECH